MSIKLDFSDCEFQKKAKGIALLLWFLLTVALVVFGEIPSTAQPSLSPSTTRFTLGQPSPRIFSVGDIEFASVHLDGFSLFQIGSPHFSPSESELNDNLSPIQRRVQRIEANLYHLIDLGFDPKTLDVRPSILNNLTVIVASDGVNLAQQVVLTVTEIDAQIDPSSVEELAQRWSQIIHTALIQAQQTRQPEARKRQFLLMTAIAVEITQIIQYSTSLDTDLRPTQTRYSSPGDYCKTPSYPRRSRSSNPNCLCRDPRIRNLCSIALCVSFRMG
jgi:small conductance mechanosensitive channel